MVPAQAGHNLALYPPCPPPVKMLSPLWPAGWTTPPARAPRASEGDEGWRVPATIIARRAVCGQTVPQYDEGPPPDGDGPSH